MRRALLALVLFASFSASAATYEVNDLGDAPDAAPGDNLCATAGAVCTLRAAIEEANAHAGADVIEFAVAGTISPATALPSITGVTTIEGRSAPGYVDAPVVLIDGAFSTEIGLHFAAGSDASELIALQVSGFSTAGVLVDANNLRIRRNYLGPVLGGTPNGDGLQLNGSGTAVGGADDGGNVISGNLQHGILATGSDHQISDNFIGTDAAGTAALQNGEDGINIDGAATGITIGGAEGEENVLSGNFDSGVQITDGSGIVIAGNFIGLDVTGTVAVPNFYGVAVESAGNVVGTPTLRNVISGNDGDGIYIDSSDTLVQNNIIGPDVTGAVGIGNGFGGIYAEATANVTIGGAGTDEGNVISFNGEAGIVFLAMETSSITGNIIGLDALGTSILGNGLEGIVLLISTEITVDSNVVSGNSSAGIVEAGGLDNIFELNRVGTTADGSLAAGNLGTGIEIAAAEGAIVRSNIVSANDGHGIETTAGATGTIIHSNIVGLSADLSTPLGNALDGINVCDGSSDTVVGSVALGGNIISANLENGIGVEPTALTNNTWAANSIYDNVGLGIDIAIDGVTANDPDDPDEGPNHYQNFPSLDSAVTSPGASQVRGTIDTRPSTAFTIHFYSSPSADPSGFGEGRTYLGAVSETTDANGDAAFIFNGPALTAGHVVTATATTSDGTSEFSAIEAVNTAPNVSFSSSTYSVAEEGVSATITVTRGGDLSAVSTVNYATSNNTATAGSDYTATSGTLTFLAGDASETFSVPITSDALDEPDEVVNLTLSNALGATLVAPSIAQLTITDNDNAPTIAINDVSLNEGTGGTTPFNFEVTLSAPSGFTVTVDYTTANDTADAGADYTAVATSKLTFTPGQTSRTVTVNVIGDNTYETDETFFVNLTNPVNATVADAQGLGTIVDDEALPVLSISAGSQAEGNAGTTPLNFTVTASGPSQLDMTVNYATDAGSADAGSDYTAQSGVATITAGTLSTTIPVPVLGDTTFEPDETFVVNLTNAVNATIGVPQATATILNDDVPPTVAINDVALAEGNGGTTNFVFTVSLAEASASDVTVNYTTANGTATPGVDYTAQTSSVTITTGTTSTTITIPVSGDVVAEPDETFFVTLTAATNATVADSQGLGTILNDEGVPTIAIGDGALAEGNGGTTAFTFPVTLSGLSASDVTVTYTTANGGTATAGTDYSAATGTATITAGTTGTTITVLVNGDTLFETDETFFVNLTGATNAAIADNQALGTILNDEPARTVSINDVTLDEGNAGTTNFTFTLTLSGTSANDVTVNYTTTAGNATAGVDYAPQSGVATISAGSLSTTITVPVAGEIVFEGDETFIVNLTGATNAAITDAQGLGTILNDEGALTVAINDVSLAEGNAGTTNFVFTVTLSGTSASDVAVNYTTANGTATAGVDYTAQSGVATITAGTLTTTITVPVTGDTTFEADETFFVNLTGATNAAITDNQGLGTIVNDEGALSVAINDVSLDEGNAGTTNFVFTLTLSGTSASDVAVNYTTADGTAAAGVDYTAQSGVATITAGTLTTTITVPVAGDAVFEADETFFVNLTGATNAAITDNQGLGTILNDEGALSVVINDVTLNEGNAGTTNFLFTVTLSGTSASDVSVNYTTADGTATAGVDYTAQSGVATITAGTLTTTITVAVTGDTTFEPDETFFVNLTGATNAAITDNQGLGTILNDDEAPLFAADLSIGKTADTTTFVPGQQVTYTITVTNAGPEAATSLTVTDVLPAGATFVSASGTGATCTGTTVVTCTIATLANGASSVITLVVVANGDAPLANTATVTAVSPADPTPINNAATATITPAPAPGAAQIPTASEWGLMMLVLALAVIALKRS
jgi:hypothetical protein